MSVSFLKEPVQFLKGVGPKRAEVLAGTGITTIGDLLATYPRRYLDRSNVVRVQNARPGSEPVTIVGTVVSAKTIPGRRKRRFELVIEDEPARRMTCVWFQGVNWVSDVFKPGQTFAFSGKPQRYGSGVSMVHPDFDRVDDDGPSLDTGRIIALYPGSQALQKVGLSSRSFRRILYTLLKERGTELKEFFPDEFIRAERLEDGRVARRAVHFPKSQEELRRARHRLKFEELFFFQLMLARLRWGVKKEAGSRMPGDGPRVGRFLNDVLPFVFTDAQKKALEDIRVDVSGGHRMNRLLQGDVGSGKTVVAVAAACMAIDAGFQVAFMAPTEILSEQHARTLRKLLEPLRIPVALLTGNTPRSERPGILTGLSDGSIPMVVGTHAVIQDGVDFHRLGLAIVDEQHRFGVMQRASLFEKGERPHVLLMTATPIPRSLALTLYGDLDVSIMRERPPGRQPVRTKMLREKHRPDMHAFLKGRLAEGRQCYVVYPLVAESEKLDLKDAESGFESLQATFPEVQVDLVHGRMKPAEKEAAMARFVAGETGILVSTTVIEVGVDVPNATVMVIEHAERFGLSQLHQLRGRIGRGKHASTCFLMAEYRQSEDSRERLRTMEETEDGFVISEKDLELRGTGDVFGTRQSGLPGFRIADPVEDVAILDQAREAAFRLVDQDPNLDAPELQDLKAWFTGLVLPAGLKMSRIG